MVKKPYFPPLILKVEGFIKTWNTFWNANQSVALFGQLLYVEAPRPPRPWETTAVVCVAIASQTIWKSQQGTKKENTLLWTTFRCAFDSLIRRFYESCFWNLAPKKLGRGENMAERHQGLHAVAMRKNNNWWVSHFPASSYSQKCDPGNNGFYVSSYSLSG